MLCQVGGFCLRVSTLSDFHIGLIMVSGRPPLPPVWVDPRVPLWSVNALVFPRVAVASLGYATPPVGLALSLEPAYGVEQCWAG